MKILTVDNTTYDIDCVPDQIDEINYCVFDASDPDPAVQDYYFLPLLFLESFHAPAICLEIGPYSIQMPMDWSIITSDEEFSDVEIIPLASLNNRGFVAPIFNPMRPGIPRAMEIRITNIYQDVKWYFPKLKHGHILAIPIEEAENPKCVYFVKEAAKIKNLGFSEMI